MAGKPAGVPVGEHWRLSWIASSISNQTSPSVARPTQFESRGFASPPHDGGAVFSSDACSGLSPAARRTARLSTTTRAKALHQKEDQRKSTGDYVLQTWDAPKPAAYSTRQTAPAPKAANFTFTSMDNIRPSEPAVRQGGTPKLSRTPAVPLSRGRAGTSRRPCEAIHRRTIMARPAVQPAAGASSATANDQRREVVASLLSG
jgi:hypothetical protein